MTTQARQKMNSNRPISLVQLQLALCLWQAGLLLETRHDRSPDRLQLALEGGRVRVSARLGSSPTKVMFAGQSLNDDIYHAVRVSRRGAKISAIVDDDEAVVGE